MKGQEGSVRNTSFLISLSVLSALLSMSLIRLLERGAHLDLGEVFQRHDNLPVLLALPGQHFRTVAFERAVLKEHFPGGGADVW